MQAELERRLRKRGAGLPTRLLALPGIMTDSNGSYQVSAKLVNGVTLAIFSALLTVIGSIIIWWGRYHVVATEVNQRLTAVETQVAREILPQAQLRLSLVESRLGQMESQLDMILSIMNGLSTSIKPK